VLGLADGSATAEQTGDAIAEFLEEAAAAGPLVVLVDDIHWAEPALLDLLESLPRRVAAPLMIVCLSRPELIERRPDWPVTVPLEPLRAAEIDALLDELDAPAGVRVRVAQASAGNPLFAEELVAWVGEGGELDEMPTSLNALLGARLDRLGQQERDVIERGAVEGELFHQAAIVELSEEPARPAIPGELGRLARKDLIRLAAATVVAGGAAYRFKHILVREAAYLATTKKARAALHERFADWLERLAGDRIGEYHEILGYHLEQAYHYRAELGERDEALARRASHHLGAAGLRANDRADIRAAANLLGRATDILPAAATERLELLRHLTYAVDQTGRMREARAISQELYERATAIGDRRLAAHGKSYATPHPFFDHEADPVAAAAAFKDVIATFEELGDQAGLAAAKRRLARVQSTQGSLSASVVLLEEALLHANACDDMSTRRAVAYSLANDTTYGPTPVGLAIPRCERLRAESGDDRVLWAAVGRHVSLLYAMAGRFDEARALEQEVSGVLEDAAVESLSWGSLGASSRMKILVGDIAGAEHDLWTKWHVYPVEAGKTQRLAIAAAYALAGLYAEQGRWDQAEECLAAFRRDKRETTNRLIVEARIASHYGNHEEAVTLARRVVKHRDATSDALTSRGEGWVALACVLRAAGHTGEADRAVTEALALFEQKGDVADAERVRAAALSVS
jgi:tetratricopeptide (TPR) repeat protein